MGWCSQKPMRTRSCLCSHIFQKFILISHICAKLMFGLEIFHAKVFFGKTPIFKDFNVRGVLYQKTKKYE